MANEFGYSNVIALHSDSELAIKQLNGSYRVKSAELRKLNEEAKKGLSRFSAYTLENVPRENAHITEVDADLNMLLDKYE